MRLIIAIPFAQRRVVCLFEEQLERQRFHVIIAKGDGRLAAVPSGGMLS